MNFWQLRCFEVLVEEMSFSEASKKLFISQQALSKHIQNLEAELNTTLVARRPKVALTQSGTIFYNGAAEILQIDRHTRKKIAQIESKRDHLKLGMGYARSRAVLPRFFSNFKESQPNIDIQVVLDAGKNLEQMLLAGELDFRIGYTAEKSSALTYIELMKDPVNFVVPKALLPANWDHAVNPLEEKKREFLSADSIPMLFLSQGHSMRDNALSYLKSLNVTPNIIMESADNETLLLMALDGLGAVFASSSLLDQFKNNSKMGGMLIYPIESPLFSDHVTLAYQPESPLPNAKSVLIAAMKKTFSVVN